MDCQSNLDKLFIREMESNISFNASKFKLLQYGKDNDLKESYNYISYDDKEILVPSNNAKDLGITASADGTFSDHIEKVCSKVKQRSGWILRSFTNRSLSFMKWAWLTYI